ncbi:MAG: redox-sensing transcriptional repressor Rex [Oscillospiraceae bacterium]|nr:redox-sensing transcriptional repressor Rex [Oscillospiraceae bacterium]
MKPTDNISPYVIKRLPRYYRYLGELLEEGRVKISSNELSQKMRITASQIRQDLNCFGGFGQQGYGYNVEILRKEISDIIGIEKNNKVIILGAGSMGQAICDNISFEKRGCTLAGIFDKDPLLHGKIIAGHQIMSDEHLPQFCREEQPKIAVLCVPLESARGVCDILIKLGIKSFWNFSHFDINHHFDNVNVENVHLGDSLLTLVYKVNVPRETDIII